MIKNFCSSWLIVINVLLTSSSHIIEIQTRMSERAIELLALPDDEPALLLDIGCGSGLSGEVISGMGHHWFGVDISEAMLSEAPTC